MKLIHYPGREAGAAARVGAHKDPGYLTLVMQDDHPASRWETAQGWIPAPPAGALVVNIGELLELASDGYLKATLHRVQSPPPGVSRLSCAFFMAARLDATVPLLSLSPSWRRWQRPQSDPANPLFYQVGRTCSKGRLRSPPGCGGSPLWRVAPASANPQTTSGQTTKSERREPQLA